MIRLLLWAGTDPAAASVTIEPVGIPSAEAIGRPKLTLRAQQNTGAGGSVSLRFHELRRLKLHPVGIASAEAFGRPKLTLVPLPALQVTAAAIGSAEAFGVPVVALRRRPRAQREQELLFDMRRAA